MSKIRLSIFILHYEGLCNFFVMKDTYYQDLIMEETRIDRFMRLYSPLNEKFERFCKARAFSEVDYKDLMHDSLIVAFEKLDQLKNEETFLYYLFGCAVRILTNKAKKKKPLLTNSMVHYENTQITEPLAERQFEIENLYSQLKKLDELTRNCIILFEISGFSIKEIMEIQKSGESAVKQRLRRGRAQLIELLKSSEKTVRTR